MDKVTLFYTSRLEIKRFEEEKVVLKTKCSELEKTISRKEGRLKDFEGKVTILNKERASFISSKTDLQHTLKKLQVRHTINKTVSSW